MKSRVQKFAFFFLVFACAGIPLSASAEAINVMVDRATILRLPEKVATIVIGNPSIADGSLQAGGLLVVTGKGYGNTNLLALDRQGDTLAEYIVTVSAPKDNSKLTVYRGVERETWSCAPKCEHSVMLGDSSTYFNDASSQIGARNGQSAKSGKP
ncbi:MAG TPA: pilus assembly protein N-terminal domain-containing protein [Xanthobacteraceae bacterium]|nr:pilus assembly protein N-terminal domain-containing protein [Xanthobacteraceae bacterium]